MPDLNAIDLEGAKQQVAGTAPLDGRRGGRLRGRPPAGPTG